MRDAEILMRYAGRYGVAVETSILAAITNAKEQFQQGGMAREQEAEFYRNFILLSQAVAPVTVMSLESCTEERNLTEFFFWRRKETYADRALRRYRVWGIVGLLLLVAVQTYWVIGIYLTGNIPMLSENESDRQQAILQEAMWSTGNLQTADKNQDTNKAKGSTLLPNETPVIPDPVRNEVESITKARVRTHTWLFDVWCSPVVKLVLWVNRYAKSPLETAAAPSWRNGIVGKYLLNILQSYVLPPLYGWMGAVAYVLRRVIGEINARTYREDTQILYNLRVFLGVLAGLAIGWFFPPNNAAGAPVLQALSPLALAFLAGYSVELLFSAMDKLLDAFSVKQSGSDKKTSA